LEWKSRPFLALHFIIPTIKTSAVMKMGEKLESLGESGRDNSFMEICHDSRRVKATETTEIFHHKSSLVSLTFNFTNRYRGWKGRKKKENDEFPPNETHKELLRLFAELNFYVRQQYEREKILIRRNERGVWKTYREKTRPEKWGEEVEQWKNIIFLE
jgi:hypothetical protein